MKKFEYYEVTRTFDKDNPHVANFEKLEDAEKFCHGNAFLQHQPSEGISLV